MMKSVERLVRRARVYFERELEILGHIIRLSAGHMLDWIRLHHGCYGRSLTDVSEQVQRKYPSACMIDVGANVGDTAAFMVPTRDASILCIEGNPDYLRLLERNLPGVSANSKIVHAYVGETNGTLAGQIVSCHGSARLVKGDGSVPTRTLVSILDEHPDFRNARLIKVDTDSYDAKIIMSAIGLLAETKPVVFVEYIPSEESRMEPSECRQMLHALADIGYSNFHVFDNFGHHMLRIPASQLDQMRSLTAYLRSAQRDERPGLHYFDICAFPAEDADLSDLFLHRYDWDC